MVWKTSCLLLLVVLFLTSLFLFIIYLLSCILSLFLCFYLFDFFVPFCIMKLYLYRFFLPIHKKKKKKKKRLFPTVKHESCNLTKLLSLLIWGFSEFLNNIIVMTSQFKHP